MTFVVYEEKIIKEFQKYLNEKGFKYWIEWGVGMIATFVIKCEDYYKWFIKQAYNDINYQFYWGR